MTIRNVTLHTAKSQPEAGERLAVIRWKSRNETIEGKKITHPPFSPTRCVSVPALVIAVEPACLQRALTEAATDLQDACIRAIFERELAVNGSQVCDPAKPTFTIDIDATSGATLAAWANEQATSAKFSGDKLVAWFDAMIAAPLLTKLALKAGFDLASGAEPTQAFTTKAEAIIAASCKVIASFASPRASYDDSTLANVDKLLALAPAGDSMAELLTAKVQKFREPAAQTLDLDI